MFTFFCLLFLLRKKVIFGGQRPFLCGELCRINVLFRSCFDADLYADIEDFVPILCRSLHKKVVINSSDFFCVPYLKKKVFLSDPSPIIGNACQ